MAAEEDRLSDLADNILSYEILSKLSLRDAVRSSILSTRWPSLWTKTPHLHFSKEFFASICPGKYTDIIDNILQQHCAPLTSFRFEPPFRCKSNTEKMKKWIECISVKGVKEISITSRFIPMIQVPATLFVCQKLTTLKLEYLDFTEFPESCLSFPCLVSCYLHYIVVETDKNIIESFIALCPQLENLRLSECYGLEDLKICAQHLKYLKVLYCSFQTLIVDCPQLMQLELIGCYFGAYMESDNCCGISAFKLNCPTSLFDVTVSEFWLLESLSAAETLMRKISVEKCELPCVSSFLNTLTNFPNLESLTIRECSVEERNMAPAREMGSGSDLNIPNLTEVFVNLTGNEVEMVNLLVENASSLNIMAINLPSCCPEIRNQILEMKKASTGAEIRIVEDKKETRAALHNKLNLELHME